MQKVHQSSFRQEFRTDAHHSFAKASLTRWLFYARSIHLNCCVSCKHFKDAHYSRTYVSPRCTQRGDDDCAYMRQYICELDGKLYEPKILQQPPLLLPSE